MKVLLNLHSLNPGGQEVQFMLLAKTLKSRNMDVGIMISQRGGILESECEKNSIPLITVNRRSRIDIVGYLSSYVKAIREFNPDLIYGGGLIPSLLKPFHGYKPVVWAVRSSGSNISSTSWLSRAQEYLSSKLIFLADSVIANSMAGRLKAEELSFIKINVDVVRNGIDTEKYLLDISGRVEKRNKYGLANEDVIIGTVSRIVPIKDHHSLFEAIAHVRTVRPNIKMVCVGSGSAEYIQELKVYADKLGISEYIAWVGQSDAMPEIYSCMDIYVSSSVSEGFPNVIAEAMSCGLPVVATDVGDCREIVSEYGWLVQPRDPEALAMALVQAVDALPRWSADKPRDHIKNNFSVDAMVDRTIAVFNSMMKT